MLKKKAPPDTATWSQHEVRIRYYADNYERSKKKEKDFLERQNGESTDPEKCGRGSRIRTSTKRFGVEESCSEGDEPRSSDDEGHRTPKKKRQRKAASKKSER